MAHRLVHRLHHRRAVGLHPLRDRTGIDRGDVEVGGRMNMHGRPPSRLAARRRSEQSRNAPACAAGMTNSLWCTSVSMSCRNAPHADVGGGDRAGHAGDGRLRGRRRSRGEGPMIGARKPKTPAKASAADDRIERIIAAPCAASEAAAPACSAPVRAATPAVVADGLGRLASRHIARRCVSLHSMNLISRSLEHVLEGGVPVLRARQQAAQLRVESARDRIAEASYSRCCSSSACRVIWLIWS